MNQSKLSLEELRSHLIRQEETIIFNLIERAQFCQNLIIYQVGGIPIPNYNGCFMEYLLHQTELIHAKVRRYTCPEEHPFTSGLPDPILPPLHRPSPIVPNSININANILQRYIQEIIPAICDPGDDENYGSSAVQDVLALQALSKRIHYGKFIAEAKFQEDPDGYIPLIRARDNQAILNKLRNLSVEEQLLKRVHRKAATYGQDLNENQPVFKIHPDIIVRIYRDMIIPLTCEVEVSYLLQRISF